MESFNVREDYRELEIELSTVDRKIHNSINENYADTRLRDYYLESANAVPEADSARVVSILQEAGAIFQERALRNIDEVANFHAEIYRNRKEFLQGEIARLSRAIDARTLEINSASIEKQRILGVLRTSGAIEALIEIQRSYADLNARHEVLLSQIEQRKKFDRRSDEIAAAIAQDKMLLKSDLEDRRSAIDEVRAQFAEYMYREGNRLTVPR